MAGGSLGGLTAALALRDAGCDVTVIERSRATLIGLGAGIVLNPATVRYLMQQPGFDLDAISISSQFVRYLDHAGAVQHEQRSPYRFSSYNALYGALLGRFDTDRYRLNSALHSIAQDVDNVTITLANGEDLHCDLLICADGIRSTARRLLCPELAPNYAGYVAMRGAVSRDEIDTDTFARLSEAITYRLMPNSHLLTYPMPFVDQVTGATQILMNWLWYRNVAEGAPLDALMTDRTGVRRDLSLPPGMLAPDRAAELHSAAAQLPPLLRDMVRATAQPFVQMIVDLEMPRMAFGRVAIIGDAAFVARPHAAAGTAKAAEDALALAAAIHAVPGNVPAALQRWEPAQLALGRAVLARTRAAGLRSQVTNTWRAGDPLPFGLHTVGDSQML